MARANDAVSIDWYFEEHRLSRISVGCVLPSMSVLTNLAKSFPVKHSSLISRAASSDQTVPSLLAQSVNRSFPHSSTGKRDAWKSL